MNKSVKNDLSVYLSKRKWYNPNTYNALDASIVFLIIIALFFALDEFVSPLFRLILDKGIITDVYLLNIISLFITQGVLFLLAFTFSKIKRVGLFSGGGFQCRINFVDILFGVILAIGIALVFYSTHLKFVDDIYQTFYGSNYSEYVQSTAVVG